MCEEQREKNKNLTNEIKVEHSGSLKRKQNGKKCITTATKMETISSISWICCYSIVQIILNELVLNGKVRNSIISVFR